MRMEVAMARDVMMLGTFEFLRVFGAAEKKSRKSRVFGSQSVEMFCFARKT